MSRRFAEMKVSVHGFILNKVDRRQDIVAYYRSPYYQYGQYPESSERGS